MATFVSVGRVGDLSPGECKVVQASGREIALYRVGESYYATDNICLHRGGPLGEGDLEGTVVTCPWHGWRYDVTTGVVEHDPGQKVETFPVVVEGDEIKVRV